MVDGEMGNIFRGRKFVSYLANGENFVPALIQVIILGIVIISITSFAIREKIMIGPSLIFSGLICLISLKAFRKDLKSAYPDIIYGFCDNSILVISSLLGYEILGGQFGAIIGAAVGNGISDALGGLAEGMTAKIMKKRNMLQERTAITASVGKLAGCMFGAGLVLTLYFSLVV